MENIPAHGEAVLERREAEHLFRVLRAVPGERFRLIDGKGNVAVAVVGPERSLAVEEVRKHDEPRLRLHLFFALPRRNRLDALLTGCAELGVRELHPVVCARSVAEGGPNDRWQLHLVEGCKQSGNPFLPHVHAPEPLLEALRNAAGQGMPLYYGSVDEAADPEFARGVGEVGWVVGPEGGFTPEEEAAMRELGVRPLHLGDWVMRLETAALCGLAVLRRLLACVAVALLFLFSGCGDADALKHPLVRKADHYRDFGDRRQALEFYRRAAEKFPRHPGVCLRLASFYDEVLGDPLGAAWYYGEYLRLAPDSPERETIAACRAAALRRLSGGAADERIGQLEEENRRLRQRFVEVKRQIASLLREREAGRRYVVRSGDTPALVAMRHQVTVEALLAANGLAAGAKLRIGQELVIPK